MAGFLPIRKSPARVSLEFRIDRSSARDARRWIGCALWVAVTERRAGISGYVLDFKDWDTINRVFPKGLEGVRLHPAPFYEAVLLAVSAFFALALKRKSGFTPT